MMTLKVTFECSFDRDVTVSSQPFEVKNSVPGGEELSSMKEIGNLGDTFSGIELRDSGKGFISKIGQRTDFNPQAVGRDSGVPFSLSNFLEDILQPTKCHPKCHQL